jgi:hypothetical protein
MANFFVRAEVSVGWKNVQSGSILLIDHDLVNGVPVETGSGSTVKFDSIIGNVKTECGTIEQ